MGKKLYDPVVVPENFYNMNEGGVMSSMLGVGYMFFYSFDSYWRCPFGLEVYVGCIKTLVDKDDLRTYGGAGVKRTMVIMVESISATASVRCDVRSTCL